MVSPRRGNRLLRDRLGIDRLVKVEESEVQASSPEIFSVKPPNGFIPPLGVYTFEVILKPQTDLPEHFPLSKDRFLVKTVPAVNITANFPERVPAEWYAVRKRHVCVDAKLKVVYTGGLVLRNLVAKGDIERVVRVFKRDLECNDSEDESGRTSLHIAASNGDVNMVHLLLAAGAKMNVKSQTGQTPFFEAISAGHGSVVKFLLEQRSVDLSTQDSQGWTALHLAASLNNLEVLRILMEHKVQLDARDKDGTTALHFAASEGHLEAVKMLVKAGANKNATSLDGLTPMHRAAGKGLSNIVEYLLDAGANKGIADLNGKTPYDIVVENGHTKLLSVIESGETLLRAAREGNMKDIDDTLGNGKIINTADQTGWTALHCASFKGQREVAEKLLDSGADVGSRDEEGHTPLHCAVEAGHTDIAKLLIERGADVNASTVHGATPLYIARAMNWNSLCLLLQKLGADPGSEPSKLSPSNPYPSQIEPCSEV